MTTESGEAAKKKKKKKDGRRRLPLLTTYPCAAEWAEDLNGGPIPEGMTGGVTARVRWRCAVCRNEWEARVDNRTLKNSGCPQCAAAQRGIAQRGIKPAKHAPVTSRGDLLAEWADPRDPATVTLGARFYARWRCSRGGHEWAARVDSRALLDTGCPTCPRGGAGPLTESHPDLCREWHPANTYGPADVTSGSDRRAWWRCSTEGCGHEWQTRVWCRARGTGCPRCAESLRTSRAERALVAALGAAPARLPVPWSRSDVADVDGFLPGAVVEYDGAYWHIKRVQADTDKTLALLDAGLQVVRVRTSSPQHTLDPLPISHPRYAEVFAPESTSPDDTAALAVEVAGALARLAPATSTVEPVEVDAPPVVS